jgi:exodeoxyribonuclease VII small subunit
MTDDINTMSFEAAYSALEETVTRLESGELALEESVDLFERGRRLSAHCQHLLDQAELRVRRIDEADA